MKTEIYSLGFMGYCSHDPAVCLLRLGSDGRIDYIHYEEGMLSRKKKSYQFPLRSIQACLDYYSISLDDVDVVAVDFMNERTFHNTAWYYRKLIGDFFRANLKLDGGKIRIIDSHHLAHAYTAYYPSGFEEAAVLSIDGLGSGQQTHSIYMADRDVGITKIYSQKGTGIGQLYSLVTQKLGFDVGEEGKTMGLAPYGEQYPELDEQLNSLKGDYLGYCVDYSRLMRRQPSPQLLIDIPDCSDKESVYDPYYSRLAYNVQKELEKCVLHLARQISERTGMENLCISGGIGLNCVANEIIADSGYFENVFVQPASGDSGVSLGLAMWGAEVLAKENGWGGLKRSLFEGEFWTYSPVKFDNDDLMHLLVNNNVRYSEVDVGFIADKIANKGIVAYFEGGWEFGPRALGHRSFLADPRTDEMKSVMNEKIKHRERYRPFAPIVQKEYFGDYFLGDAERYSHMLFAAQCNNKAVDEIPAIVHVDCTARVQVCDKKSGNVYNIIDAFRKLTGVPVLINTSFNDNNEPIVLDPVDALSCFLRTNADVLVVNDIMIERSDVQDIDMLLKKAVDFQRSALYKKTDKAINELLNKNVFNIDEFISRELLSSLYFKFNDSYDRLAQEFFCKEVSGGVLVTDSYHLKVLNKMSCYYKKEIPFAEIVTVDDVLSSCIEVPENAYVLLYNVSVLMEDAEVRAKYPFLSSCTTFYSSEDRVVMEDMSMMDCKELSCFVKGTYEVDLNNSVDDYFKKSVYPVFVGRYLI